ncbi:DGQHR domain-containing protein [Cellulophaga sp. Ld12]|uniref:DGQHR domain-containing protein n=1 Tax=Cellulophaga sp. Ld12 TaxID=3229535 RepID=UPI003869890E
MKSLEKNIFSGFSVIQNKQDFIVSSFTIDQILKFTKYTERLIVNYDEEGQPIYNNNIQRKVELIRAKKIADFLVNDPDATFPTNLVLHIPEEIIVEKTEKNNFIHITINEKVFDEINKKNGDVFISIIDGQHRIKGIELAIEFLKNEISILNKSTRNTNDGSSLNKKLDSYNDRLKDLLNIQLVVTFFIDKTLEYQAMIFSTINRTQKKVSASLVSSLFGLTARDTPHKTALQTVLALNGHESSPFYKRIKLYGGSYNKNQSPPLTQATMVSSVIKQISENLREAENDRYRNREELKKRTSGSSKPLVFRKWYANDRDDVISDFLYFYFSKIRDTFKDDNGVSFWDVKDNNKNILQTTVGYLALLENLIEILVKENINDQNMEAVFGEKLSLVDNISFNDTVKYSFNNNGKKILQLELSLKMYPKEKGDLKDKRAEVLNSLVTNN